jgi:hypothetical protein
MVFVSLRGVNQTGRIKMAKVVFDKRTNWSAFFHDGY